MLAEILSAIDKEEIFINLIQCAADKFVHRFGLIVRVYGGTADFI